MNFKKICLLLTIFALFPILVLSKVEDEGVQNKKISNGVKEIGTASSSNISSTTKTAADLTKTRTMQAANNLIKKNFGEISKFYNIIDRLSNKNSIVAKLEAKNVNTSAIRAKLDSAKEIVAEVEKSLTEVRATITHSIASSTPNSKTKFVGIRSDLDKANKDLRLAVIKIKEANKLIREIPQVREIEKNQVATSSLSASSTSHQ